MATRKPLAEMTISEVKQEIQEVCDALLNDPPDDLEDTGFPEMQAEAMNALGTLLQNMNTLRAEVLDVDVPPPE